MRDVIDVNSLTLDQARALLKHHDEHLNAITAANNSLIGQLSSVIAHECAKPTADRFIQMLNEWSAFLENVSLTSKDEQLKILQTRRPDGSALH